MKLTDEEIVKTFETCVIGKGFCPRCSYNIKNIDCTDRKVQKDTLDLIHRLQSENDKLETAIDIMREQACKVVSNQRKCRHCEGCFLRSVETDRVKYKAESLRVTIAKQKAEIERLKTELSESRSIINTEHYKYHDYKDYQSFEIERLKKENAELQKQVDELTEQRNKNYLNGEIIMKDEKTLLNEIKEQCGDCEAWSGTDCTRNPYTQGCLKDEKQVIECHGMLKGCDMVQQAVKDTAKEILIPLMEMEKQIDPLKTGIRWSTLKGFCKKFGIEVE